MWIPSFLLRTNWNSRRDPKPLRCWGKAPTGRSERARCSALRLEVLEDRTLPSILIVTSAADDSSAGTLRSILTTAQN
jgi:hypothetical protein